MSRAFARTLVFVSSAAVLVIEILAGRLIAPYLGVSLETFTGIIGTILAGISVGAWAGGAAADRGEPRRLIGPLIGAGGVLTLLAPPVVDVIGPALIGTGPVGIVLLAGLGFFAPAAVLSAVTPVVIKERLASLADTGTVVGSFSAVGTAGAIFGTFLTGFVLIAALPTRPIMLALGGALVVAGALLTARWRSGGAAGAVLAAALLPAAILIADRGPCEYETTYHCAIVEVDADRPSGRLLWLDRTRNSYVDLEDPTYLEFGYLQVVADVLSTTHPPPDPVRAVAVGGGGFTFPALLDATRPGSETTVLEIDPILVEIGRNELGLSPETDVVVGDARMTLRAVTGGGADIVLGDAFSGLSVPWHLTTIEFVDEIRRVLRPDGIYLLNLIDYRDLDFVRSELATLREGFANVVLIAPPNRLAGEPGGNFVIAATDRDLDEARIAEAIEERGRMDVIVSGDDLTRFIGDVEVLSDDFAPVDQMLDRS